MNILRNVFICLFFCLSVCLFLFPSSAQAALLKFDQTTVSVSAGQTFQIQAIVDAQSDQITSTDMWITYDPTLIEAQTASPAAFFPAVTSNISAGKTYVAGLITEPGSYKTGSGTVAIITFKGLKNGTATLAYDCRADASNSSKVIKNAVDPTNIIVCTQNGTSVVTIGTGGVVPTLIPTSISSPYQSTIQPTGLPQSGIMDQFPKIAGMGAFLLIVGVILQLMIL